MGNRRTAMSLPSTTPHEFLTDCLMAEGQARYVPSRCEHGQRLTVGCHACDLEWKLAQGETR